MKNLTDIELINKKHHQERVIKNQETLMVEQPEYFSPESYDISIKALEMITNEMARRVGENPANYL